MSRISRTYRLSAKTLDDINKIAIEQHLSRERAIEFVVQNYIEKTEKEDQAMILLQETLMAALKKVQEDLSRIRGASNNIDRHTQMQLEFWNHYFVVNPSKEFVSTDKFKRKEMSEADALVKKRIGEARQKKLDYEKNKKGSV